MWDGLIFSRETHHRILWRRALRQCGRERRFYIFLLRMTHLTRSRREQFAALSISRARDTRLTLRSTGPIIAASLLNLPDTERGLEEQIRNYAFHA